MPSTEICPLDTDTDLIYNIYYSLPLKDELYI